GLGIDIYVDDKVSYLQRNKNFTRFYKKIESEYLAKTGKSNAREVIIRTLQGYYFAWESPFPDNVTRDEELANIIDLSYIISEYRKGIDTRHLIRYYPFAKEQSNIV
ncbi:MAG TPA: hypothetical protein VM577_07930, partial [Anaerovoracaceae bacterium]|nr:hypothetical protein [Anaerovoracaceae bacterium]